MREHGSGRLVEREREVAELRTAVDDACSRAGALVLVDGEGGIGKSRICDAAAELTSAAGMQVFTARGGELEHDLTYGIARQLFERSLRQLGPSVRKSVLSGPARLARPALDLATEGLRLSAETGIDHGLYWLTSNLAERTPLALIVDDAHWADAASLRFLVYLSRRLDGLAAMIVVAARSGEPVGEGRPLELLGAEPACRRLTLRPLSRSGVAALLSARLDRGVSEPLASSCHEVSGGNPFLIGEIARTLSGDDAYDATQAATLAPRAVTRSILLRLGRQRPESRAVAEALAAAGDGVAFGVLCEIVGAEPAAVGAALDGLAREGITSGGCELGFAHPIVRTAIYEDLPHWRRQQLHGRAAKALSERGDTAGEVAHHLLLAEPEGSAAAVERLREAGRLALERGSLGNAIRLLARALAEPPGERDRAPVLTELGEAELRAGRAAEAAGHLTEALALAPTDDVRVRAAVAAASALLATEGPEKTFKLLEDEARSLEGEDSLRLDVERATLAMWVRGSVQVAWLPDVLARFAEFDGVTPVERLGLTQAALAAAYDPDGAAAHAASIARRALANGSLLAELSVDAMAVGMAAYASVMSDDLDGAEPEVKRMLTNARDRGSLFGLAATKLLAGQIALTRGRLADAADNFELSLGTSRGLEESPVVMRCTSFAESWLVETLLRSGDVQAAREVVLAAATAGDFERPELVWSRYGRGLLRLLSDEDPDGAIEDLLAFGEAARAGGYEDRGAPWREWAALALARAGRREEAVALVDEQLEIASAWCAAAHGAALRVRAVVGAPQDAEPLLDRATELLQGSVRVLASSEALVDHGVALRRVGRRTDARSQLEKGLEAAARCGAVPLIERAKSELAVLGARPRRLMFSGVDGLTASERRVAAMAAEGIPNREIAASLFVTVKTVETHLRSAYRKLDIRSRNELAAKLAEPAGASAG